MAQPALILYIDDDQEDIEIFKSSLAAIDSGIICPTAHNGKEGLDILRDGVVLPDLIFLDINMPVLNGRDCLLNIRRDDVLKIYRSLCTLHRLLGRIRRIALP